MEKSRSGKKKWIAVIVIAAIVVVLIASAAMRSGKKKDSDTSSSVKSVKVTNGTIKNTITASGNLAEADSTDFKIPSGITVKEVLVEAGDEVKKGDVLAKADTTSVKEQIYQVRNSISTIDSTLKSIKSKTSAKYTSQREMLNAQKKDLNKALSQLQKINKSGKITSTVSGTIESVNVTGTDDASTSTSTQTQTGSTSQVSSALSGITGMSTGVQKVTAVQLSEKVPVTTSSDGTIASSDGSTSSEKNDEKNDTEKKDDQTDISGNGKISDEELEKMIQEQQKNRGTTSSSSNSGKNSSQSTNSLTGSQQQALSNYSGLTSENASSAAGSSSLINGNSALTSGSSALSGVTSGSTDNTLSSASSDITYTSAFTISTGDKMDIDLSVDELDILDVEEGQSVTVTLDALDDQEFSGEITKVSHIGTNSGGSTKYTATCQIDKTDDMLVGMTATAVIDVDSAENVLTLPLSAVQEENGTSYVYTENNNGKLGGRTKVTTGLSDDNTVEITDGLSEGDTVYYKDLSGQELTSSQNNVMNMGGNMQRQQEDQGGRGGNDGGTPPSGGPGGNGGN